jgi:hypothetical protein
LEVAVNRFVSRESSEGSEVHEGATELRAFRSLRCLRAKSGCADGWFVEGEVASPGCDRHFQWHPRAGPRAVRQPIKGWPRLAANSYQTGAVEYEIKRHELV